MTRPTSSAMKVSSIGWQVRALRKWMGEMNSSINCRASTSAGSAPPLSNSSTPTVMSTWSRSATCWPLR